MRADLRMHARGGVAVAGAVATVAVALLAAALSPAPARATPDPAFGSSPCVRAERSATPLGADLSLLPTERALIARGERLDLRANNWRLPGLHRTTLLQVHSGGWLVTYARTDLADAVDLAVEQATLSPDPGGAAPPTELAESGWNEAIVTGRMSTIRCLHALSADPRLVPVMESLVAANMDEVRYYGPPRRNPHNHGAMANRALLQAAGQFNRPEWADFARGRIAAVADLTFDECGMVFEQSSTYQEHNAVLWTQFADELPNGEGALIAERARQATATLTRPDGILPAIGTGNPRVPKLGITPNGQSMWCPRSGWAVYARTDAPVQQHAVVRFGPRTVMHGHDDKGSFTWWVGGADGVPVLSDPGVPDKRMLEQTAWAVSARAHSVLQRTSDPFVRGWQGVRVPTVEGMRYNLSTSRRRDTATRTIDFTTRLPIVSVNDWVEVTDDPVFHRYRQRFTLDPVWQRPVDVPDVEPMHLAETVDGHTLDVLCIANEVIRRPLVLDVESFPTKTTVMPALQVVCPAATVGDVRMRALVFVDTLVEAVVFEGEGYAIHTDRGIVLLGPEAQFETVALPGAPPL